MLKWGRHSNAVRPWEKLFQLAWGFSRRGITSRRIKYTAVALDSPEAAVTIDDLDEVGVERCHHDAIFPLSEHPVHQLQVHERLRHGWPEKTERHPHGKAKHINQENKMKALLSLSTSIRAVLPPPPPHKYVCCYILKKVSKKYVLWSLKWTEKNRRRNTRQIWPAATPRLGPKRSKTLQISPRPRRSAIANITVLILTVV